MILPQTCKTQKLVSDHVAETKDIFFQFETTDKEYRFQLRLLTLKDAKKGHRALLAKINVLSRIIEPLFFTQLVVKFTRLQKRGLHINSKK